MNCYLCGTCTAGCPWPSWIRLLSAHHHEDALWHEGELLALKEIWKCSSAGAAQPAALKNDRPSDVI
jgi:heterodisulfide reductase subunit C